MEERVLRLVWCEECCNRYWELMSGLGESGCAVSKSGRLKVPVGCDSCGNELAVGEEATAFTLDGGEYVPWECDYLDLDAESGGEAGDE